MNFQNLMTALQTVILLLGLGAAVWTLFRQKADTKAMATLNIILHQRDEQGLRNAALLVAKLSKQKKGLIPYLHQPYSREKNAILKLLNFRETVAVGINRGILNEDIYKQAFFSMVLHDWITLKDVVAELRKQHGSITLFQDFERLANRWEKHPLESKRA